jgi:hypothetical protein
MTKQEENWELMTILQIPWSESLKITDASDREFLLKKAGEVKEMLQQQHRQGQSGIITPH